MTISFGKGTLLECGRLFHVECQITYISLQDTSISISGDVRCRVLQQEPRRFSPRQRTLPRTLSLCVRSGDTGNTWRPAITFGCGQPGCKEDIEEDGP